MWPNPLARHLFAFLTGFFVLGAAAVVIGMIVALMSRHGPWVLLAIPVGAACWFIGLVLLELAEED